MINIRQKTIDLPANGLEILTLIRLDTTDFRWIFGNNYFFHPDKIDKPWFGKISVKDGVFEIRRNGLGYYIDQLSAIIIEGTLTKKNKNYKLQVNYNLSILRTLCFTGFVLLSLASPFSGKGISGILALIIMLTFLSILTIRDFKRTEKRFNKSIDRVQSRAPQHNTSTIVQ
jgi:hypothetical protein